MWGVMGGEDHPPKPSSKNSTGDPGDVDGVTVPYDDIWELEVKGVVYSRLGE